MGPHFLEALLFSSPTRKSSEMAEAFSF